MRMVMVCLVAGIAAACGCSTVPSCTSGCCGTGGPNCNPGGMIWDNYCSGGDPCMCTPDCRPCRRNIFDVLFGSGECSSCTTGFCGETGCASGNCASGNCGPYVGRECADGTCGNFAPVVTGGHAIVGCAGNACDGRCGGRCAIAMSRAGAIAHGAVGTAANAAGMAVHHVAQAPQRIHDNCANGHRGLAPGPTQGAVAYPYYTTRGPRDFLLAKPPSIGP